MVLVFVFERKEIRCRYVLNLGLASWLASGAGSVLYLFIVNPWCA